MRPDHRIYCWAMDMNASVTILRAVDTVYAFVSDPRNDVKWRTGVTESGLESDPPLRLGSEGFAATPQGSARWRVTTFEPPGLVEWDLISGPIAGTGGYRLEPVGESTRFTLLADVAPTGAMRLLGPLFARIGRKQNQADVTTLKELLERSPD